MDRWARNVVTMRCYRRVGFILLCAFFGAAGLHAFGVGEELDELGHDFQTPRGLLNLRIVENRFRAYFVDEERLIVEPPYLRIVLFTEEMRRVDRRERLVLTPTGDGSHATHPRVIPPPHDFWVRMVLVESEDEEEHDTVPRTLFRGVATESPEGGGDPAAMEGFLTR